MSINRLAESASLILHKFTEGREDWHEFTCLADALRENLPRLQADIGRRVLSRVSEFERRRDFLES